MNAKAKLCLLSFLFATIVTVVGRVGLTFKAQEGSLGVIIELFRLLLLPGGLFAAIVAAIFSPQGFHGIDDYEWLIAPVSWLMYFLLFFKIFRRDRKSQDSSA